MCKKGYNHLNPHLLMVLLSILCNKLPCVLVEMVSTRSTTPDTKERETIRLKLPIAACIVLTWLLGLHILTGFLLFDVFLFSFFFTSRSGPNRIFVKSVKNEATLLAFKKLFRVPKFFFDISWFLTNCNELK